jgi:phosphoglycolate phosphatase
VAKPERRLLIGIDLDGTIEDSRSDMVAAAARVRRELGLPARADDLLRPYVNGGMEQLYRACFDDFVNPNHESRLQIVQHAYEADYLANVRVDTKLYDGMQDALHGLARVGMLVCVTNKPERISRALLDALGVGELFSSVVGGDSCTHAKPHPIMLETAALRSGFDRPRGTAFMIGDTNADIQLARAYGAHAIWCAWGYVNAPSEAPDAQARHPQELVSIVERQMR